MVIRCQISKSRTDSLGRFPRPAGWHGSCESSSHMAVSCRIEMSTSQAWVLPLRKVSSIEMKKDACMIVSMVALRVRVHHWSRKMAWQHLSENRARADRHS